MYEMQARAGAAPTPTSQPMHALQPTQPLQALKQRQHAAWSAGDYSVVGTTLQIVGERLCEAVDLRASEHVLDVAAGNGNASLAAARRFANVTSTDYVPALLSRGRERALAERLPIRFEEADAEALPFADGSFDVVLSTFGVMFTADHDKAAAEMLRVCRDGGRIGLANWTPDGFIGQVLQAIGRYLPPGPGARPASRWGTHAWLDDAFGPDCATVRSRQRAFVFRYRSPQHWLELFSTWYGPMRTAFEALDTDAGAALQAELLVIATRCNRGGSDLVVPSTYLETTLELRHARLRRAGG